MDTPTLTLDLAKRSTDNIKTIWSLFNKKELKFGTTVTLIGSCVTVRKGKAGKMLFIELLDGSTVKTIQCICDSAPDELTDPRYLINWQSLFDHCCRGATVELIGSIESSPAPLQPIELIVKQFTCLGSIKEPEKYFLGQRGFIGRDILRHIPHQRGHTQLFVAIQIIKQQGYKTLHEAMALMDVGEIQGTLLTGNECEDGAHPFTVTTLLDKQSNNSVSLSTGTIDWSKDFFGKRVYLTVSSQLHLEASVLSSKRDSYCMTVAFRAEPSTSICHLAEFVMPEWEIIGGGLNRNMAIAQTLLKYIFTKVLENCQDELAYLESYRKQEDDVWYSGELASIKELRKDVKTKKISNEDLELKIKQVEAEHEKRQGLPSIIDRLTKYRDQEFAITTHEQCVKIMLSDIAAKKVKFDVVPAYEDDLTRQHEYYISEVIFKGLPTFIRYFPKKIKAFYMPVIKEDTEASRLGIEHVEGYDLIFPLIGEVIGGSQRISSEDELVARMTELNMDLDELAWYIKLRQDATLPHGGAGLGLGRLFMVMTGIFNIKDMQEFPRGAGLKCFA